MAIRIEGLTKRFGATPVLKGVDLDVADGELVALLGPSGSGKTTLLRILAGLEWPDYGVLEVDGEDWLKLEARKRRIGFVFQHYALFPHMRVRDNIAFGLTVRPRRERPSSAEIARRVDDLLGFLQIAHLADRFPSELSGGQRQRVALGRAMAIDPRVLLLDEPFGALDAAIRRDLRRWLRGVHDATGTTTLFVTHDQEEAFELADRVVVMGHGQIEQVGGADAIYDHPATPFVARFLGGVNEIPVSMHAGRAGAPGVDASEIERIACRDGAATLVARPADIGLAPDATSPWRVESAAHTGPSLALRLTDGAGGAIDVELPRREARGLDLSPGAAVRVIVHAARVFPDTDRPAAPAATPVLKPLKEAHT
ncbi:MAG: sulfate ABC transporter ATP-binding protein [Rhodobacteraceae bacterium]|nr:MAG: sulfate ABC transporter ATP-binding protein [Paracoccaceae bacterium]